MGFFMNSTLYATVEVSGRFRGHCGVICEGYSPQRWEFVICAANELRTIPLAQQSRREHLVLSLMVKQAVTTVPDQHHLRCPALTSRCCTIIDRSVGFAALGRSGP